MFDKGTSVCQPQASQFQQKIYQTFDFEKAK